MSEGPWMRTVDEIRKRVLEGVERYNNATAQAKRVVRVELFGSYAEGRATDASDVDLLVEFVTPNVGHFDLAVVLEAKEAATGMSVDVVQSPPADSLLEIGGRCPCM